MKILLLGLDKSAFEEGSYFRKRLGDYRRSVEWLDVIAVGDHDRHVSIDPGLDLYMAGSPFKPWSFFKLYFKAAAIIKSMPDRSGLVVSVQDPFFTGLVGVLLKYRFGVALHTQIHVEFFSRFYRKESRKHFFELFIANFVIRHSDRVRPVSEKIAKYCREVLHTKADRIDVIPLSVDVDRIGNSVISIDLHKQYPRFSKIVLMASRLVKQKNIPLALSAFREMLATDRSLGLVIVGRGPEEKSIRDLVTSSKLEDNVVLLPWSDGVSSLMKTSDVFLLTSNYEGYVMTAMEACLSGSPVVMTDVGGAGEFIKDGYNGCVVPIGDKPAVVRALDKILFDPRFRDVIMRGVKKSAAKLPYYAEYVNNIVCSWERALNRRHHVN